MLRYITIYCIILYYIILCYTILYDTILDGTMLYYTILYHTYHTVPYYTTYSEHVVVFIAWARSAKEHVICCSQQPAANSQQQVGGWVSGWLSGWHHMMHYMGEWHYKLCCIT